MKECERMMDSYYFFKFCFRRCWRARWWQGRENMWQRGRTHDSSNTSLQYAIRWASFFFIIVIFIASFVHKGITFRWVCVILYIRGGTLHIFGRLCFWYIEYPDKVILHPTLCYCDNNSLIRFTVARYKSGHTSASAIDQVKQQLLVNLLGRQVWTICIRAKQSAPGLEAFRYYYDFVVLHKAARKRIKIMTWHQCQESLSFKSIGICLSQQLPHLLPFCPIWGAMSVSGVSRRQGLQWNSVSCLRLVRLIHSGLTPSDCAMF